MVRCEVLLVVLIGVVAATPVASAQPGEMCGERLPLNLSIELLDHDRVTELLRQSPTLRRQCLAIAAAAYVRVVVASPPFMDGDCRARARFTRSASGSIEAEIQIPGHADYAELLAHELEHVVEQIEGLNLRQLSRARHSGVHERQRGVFETRRAQTAGRAAAREVVACRTLTLGVCDAAGTSVAALR